MIVMEYIDTEAKLQKLPLEKKKHVYNEVKKAIELLHNKDVLIFLLEKNKWKNK